MLDTEYPKKADTMILRAMLMVFWKNNIGIFNKAINNLLTFTDLEEEKNKLKSAKTNTKVGNRWQDKNHKFLGNQFLPELIYYTFNNIDYLRFKSGAFIDIQLKTKQKVELSSAISTQYKLFKISVFQNKVCRTLQEITGFQVYALDVDLSKAHAKISTGLTQDNDLIETDRIIEEEGWEGVLKELRCEDLIEVVGLSDLKKGLKALYYKGIQGAPMNTKEHVSRTFVGTAANKDREPSIKFSNNNDEDFKIKERITYAWLNSRFNSGAQALSKKIKNTLEVKESITQLVCDVPLNINFTRKQVNKSSPAIRIVSDILVGIFMCF